MGLFDKLLKEGEKLIKEGEKLVKEVATEENKDKARELFGKVKETFSDEIDVIKEAAKEFKEKQKEEEEKKASVSYEFIEDGKTCRERILECLAAEFPQYHVEEGVSPREMGGTGRFMDYSLVIVDENDIVRLIIMLIGKTTCYHREYRWSREFAEERNIPFINFINHYPNRPEYISERLHKYL